MKLKEYMQEYNRKVLTKLEAQAFGLPDMKSGWPKRYAELEISEDMLRHILNAPRASKANRKVRKKIKQKIITTKKYETTNEQLLYLMKNENGLLKIGISVDPVKRARQLSTGSGVNVICLAAWKLDKNVRMVENYLHKKFVKDRLEGEWFKPESMTVQSVQEKIECNFEIVYSEAESVLREISIESEEYTYSSIKYQTQKAILFDIQGKEVWCPKSRILHMNEVEQVIKVPKNQFS